MAVSIANNGTALTRADIYYNDNGTIKNIDDMEVWVRNGNNMYKFPQKDFCALNLDNTSFSLNTLDGASTYLTNNFELWQDTTQKTNLGDIIDADPQSASGFKVNNVDKYWWINDVGFTNLYFGSLNFFEFGKITVSMTIKLKRNPSAWNDLWVFRGTEQLRCEWNGNDLRFQIYAQNLQVPTTAFYPQADYINNFIHLDFVLDGTTIKGYQNGQEVFTATIARAMSENIPKIHICTNRGQASPFGSGVYIKNFTIWRTALSQQELSDYWNCIGII